MKKELLIRLFMFWIAADVCAAASSGESYDNSRLNGNAPHMEVDSDCSFESEMTFVNVGNGAAKIVLTPKGKLFQAIRDGHISIVEELVEEKGISPLCIDTNKCTTLITAARANNIRLVRYFINKGVDVCAKDKNGIVAFNFAAENGNLTMCNLLIEAGAKPTLRSLFCAAQTGEKDTLDYILEKGSINIDDVDTERRTALHFAAWSAKVDFFSYLVSLFKKKVGLEELRNLADKKGSTPLHDAANGRNIPVVRYLIEELGMNPLAKNKNGFSALDCTNTLFPSQNPELIQYLEEKIKSFKTKESQ